MSLIRGVNCLKPCPGCYVPGNELSNISKIHDLRTTEDTKRIYGEAQSLNATDKEEHLKEYGLRDVEVINNLLSALIFVLNKKLIGSIFRMRSGL